MRSEIEMGGDVAYGVYNTESEMFMGWDRRPSSYVHDMILLTSDESDDIYKMLWSDEFKVPAWLWGLRNDVRVMGVDKFILVEVVITEARNDSTIESDDEQHNTPVVLNWLNTTSICK